MDPQKSVVSTHGWKVLFFTFNPFSQGANLFLLLMSDGTKLTVREWASGKTVLPLMTPEVH